MSALGPLQCRVAREALGWTQRDLAERSGLGFTTVKRFELGKPVHQAFSHRLRQAFLDAGVLIYDEGSVVEGRRVRLGIVLLDPKDP